jgi:hypothetical protein
MAAFDQDDWTQRVIATFPKVWAQSSSFQPGGGMYTLVFNTAGLTFLFLKGAIDYTQLQTRIATATDLNLEAIANDFFGANNFPRFYLLDAAGLNLVPETDEQYSQRISNGIFAPKNTIAAIQAVVQLYLTTQYIAETVSNVMLLGEGTAGGLGTRGGLDGVSKSVPELPQVTVFDRKSNPALSTKIGLQPSQFCILFSYGGLSSSGFFVGRSFLGRSDYLVNPAIQIIAPITSTLDGIVRATKAVGTVPVYADNRTA